MLEMSVIVTPLSQYNKDWFVDWFELHRTTDSTSHL